MIPNNSPQTSSPEISRRSSPSDFTVGDFNRLWRENEAFRNYARQVYHYLDTMHTGRKLLLTRIPADKLKWLMVTAVAFISEGVHFLSYEFTDDYTAIRHLRADPWEVQRAIEYKFGPLNTE